MPHSSSNAFGCGTTSEYNLLDFTKTCKHMLDVGFTKVHGKIHDKQRSFHRIFIVFGMLFHVQVRRNAGELIVWVKFKNVKPKSFGFCLRWFRRAHDGADVDTPASAEMKT